MIFSDESKFDVCVGDCCKRIIRNKNEAFNSDCLKRTVKFPRGIMVWGCMSAKGMGTLTFVDGIINAQEYQDILQNSLLPSITKLYPNGNYVFQQDGAPCHMAKSTKKWFGTNQINVLSHLAASPEHY